MLTTLSIESLIANCNDAYPAAGTWGYMTLLRGALTTGLGYTVDPASDLLTTAAPHGLVTGSRIRLVGGTLPFPALSGTDYFAIVSSPTTLSLAATLADAQLATAFDLTDAGSGALTITEQVLTAVDPLSVLVNREVLHPSWTGRALIDNLGVATNVGGKAQKSVKILPIANTSVSDILSYQHLLFIETTSPAAAAWGNIPAGAGYQLLSEAGVQTIGVGDPSRAVFFTLRMRNL